MTSYDTFSDAWFREMSETRARGEERFPRGLPTRERRWTQLEVLNPMTFPVAAYGRKFRDVIGVLEGLSLVGQVSVPELFTDRVRNFANFTDSGIFHGAYGIRAFGHLGDLCSLLQRDGDTRQAVLSVYDSDQDLGNPKRDVPCTLSLHFMGHDVRELDLRVTMRSNDMWLGTPYDFTQFAILQASVAQAVGRVPGTYVHSVGSLHLYERDLDEAIRVAGPADMDMGFPLWGCADDIAEISSRARRLLLDPHGFATATEFEAWAKGLLIR